jgi:glutaredoxin-related protein
LVSENQQQEVLSEVMIIEGSVMVHILTPDGCKTFDDYANKKFLPYILTELQYVQRLDVIRDVYQQDSLKNSTRERRGKGKTRRVIGKGDLPGN